MREFFKPWRRKSGVALLMLACVFMAVWVRSEVDADFLTIRDQNNFIYQIGSQRGMLIFSIRNETFGAPWPLWSSWDVGAVADPWGDLIIPFWSIVLPLALVSAYLLLSKPRPKPNQSDDTKSPHKTFDIP